MSQNTNNIQENSPKSFGIMANALGVTESEFVELEGQKAIERQEMEERVYPKIWRDSMDVYFNTLISVSKSINEAVSTLTDCVNTLKKNDYPKSGFDVQWGLSSMKQLLEIHQSQLTKSE
jgi:hypothetical protein